MTEQEFRFEEERKDPEFNFAMAMAGVRQQTGKGVGAQVRELLKLQFGSNKLGREEYYLYGLYDDDRFDWEAKTRFASRKVQGDYHRICNQQAWYVMGQDKLVANCMLQSLGLNVPPTLAVFDKGRVSKAFPVFSEAAALADFLRGEVDYPIFGKPIYGAYSLATAALISYDAASDMLTLGTGEEVSVDAFARAVKTLTDSHRIYFNRGYMFQPLMRPHPEIEKMSGLTLATVRMMLMVKPDGPELFRASWKIPVGDHPADNFWRKGNVMSGIDVKTGIAGQGVTGKGLERSVVETHPLSGVPVGGFQFPQWDEMVQLVTDACGAFPGLRLQGWDVAMTDRGAMLVEVNGAGDYDLPQLAYGEGLLQPDLVAFVDSVRAENRSTNLEARARRRKKS